MLARAGRLAKAASTRTAPQARAVSTEEGHMGAAKAPAGVGMAVGQDTFRLRLVLGGALGVGAGAAYIHSEIHREAGGMRQEIHREFGGLRQEMHRELGGLRGDIGAMREQAAAFHAATTARLERAEADFKELKADFKELKAMMGQLLSK